MKTPEFVNFMTTVRENRKPEVAAFEAVRNMPYATDAAHDAQELLEKGRGDCLAKSDLLFHALTYLGLQARFVRWRYSLPSLPGTGQLSVPFDLHRAIEVCLDRSWSLVDATHDPPLSSHLPVAKWDGRGPTEPAYEPVGPIMRVGIDNALISLAASQVAVALRELDPEELAAYIGRFNSALEAIRRHNNR